MPVDTDTFIASFGDRPLEFELAIESIRYEEGDVVVDWSLEKLSDTIGGITYEVVLNTPEGEDSHVENDNNYSRSGTLRAPAEPGDGVDLILYDTLNTDHEPGSGLDDGGEAQVNATVPKSEPKGSLISVTSCSAGGEITEGERATVGVSVRNENPIEVRATVTVAAGDATAEEGVDLPAGEEQTVVVTFQFDEPGEYPVEAEVSL